MLLFPCSVLNCTICVSMSWLSIGLIGSCDVICAISNLGKSSCDSTFDGAFAAVAGSFRLKPLIAETAINLFSLFYAHDSHPRLVAVPDCGDGLGTSVLFSANSANAPAAAAESSDVCWSGV